MCVCLRRRRSCRSVASAGMRGVGEHRGTRPRSRLGGGGVGDRAVGVSGSSVLTQAVYGAAFAISALSRCRS